MKNIDNYYFLLKAIVGAVGYAKRCVGDMIRDLVWVIKESREYYKNPTQEEQVGEQKEGELVGKIEEDIN